MTPLILSAAGLATRIRNVASSAAPMIGAAAARLRATGAVIGDTADDVIAWARANPGNAVMAALTLGSLGVAVDDLFETPEGKDLANKVTSGAMGLGDVGKILSAGSASEKLNLQVAEVKMDLYTAREILRWAKSHYGSASAAVSAHKLGQAFFEMALDDVESGFELVRL